MEKKRDIPNFESLFGVFGEPEVFKKQNPQPPEVEG